MVVYATIVFVCIDIVSFATNLVYMVLFHISIMCLYLIFDYPYPCIFKLSINE